MGSDILAACNGAGATIIAALIGKVAIASARNRRSLEYRYKQGLPNPLGKWNCDWFNEDGTLYVSDEVDIKTWVKDGRFQGLGIQPALSYTVDGEVDGTRIMALTYRTVEFPNTAYVGVACLEFSMDGNSLSGYWHGRARTGKFGGGKMQWRRGPAG